MPVITIDEVVSDEAFTLSDVSDMELPQPEDITALPGTIDHTETVLPETGGSQTSLQSIASKSSDTLLAVPTTTAQDKADEEVMQKGGMTVEIARTFLVSISQHTSIGYIRTLQNTTIVINGISSALTLGQKCCHISLYMPIINVQRTTLDYCRSLYHHLVQCSSHMLATTPCCNLHLMCIGLNNCC